MGFLLQKQRRAIEEVLDRKALDMRGKKYFLLEGEALIFLGVSEGVGTCSDKKFHGINVAVFCRQCDAGLAETKTPRQDIVDGAVLLRKRKGSETDVALSDASAILAVEGLTVTSCNNGSLVFASNSRSKLYVHLC